MKNFVKAIVSIFIFTLFAVSIQAQQFSENGEKLPVQGTIRVLLIFAEVDSTGCPEKVHADNTTWPPGDVPPHANTLFDAARTTSPQSIATAYYQEASFGQYRVLGDYIDTIVTVPCNQISDGYVFNFLNALPDPLLSANGYPLDSFDLWKDEGDVGLLKATGNNDTVDVAIVIWRNRNTPAYHCCGCGYGASTVLSGYSLKGKKFYIGASYTDCIGGIGLFITEYFHAMFGDNNFHTSGGAANHTFPFPQGSYSITGQYASSSSSVCGWDRWFMGWYGWKDDDFTLNKDSLIAALDNSRDEKFGAIEIPSTAIADTFILRDFQTTGDAIRIKLPHIDWQQNGDVKNQYLWLENHQFLSDHDQRGGAEPETPGIYAQIQVGKESKKGDFGPVYPSYSANSPAPNSLASYLFPLAADGQYDFNYLLDSVQYPGWGLPYDKTTSLPNPFTGLNDLFNYYNWNGDSLLHSGLYIPATNTRIDLDSVQPGGSELVNGRIVWNNLNHGDSTDAFTRYVRNRITISTNPASIPVYTFTSGDPQSKSTGAWQNTDPIRPYENRTIWLNGLSIEIIDEIANETVGGNDLKVVVRWDNYEIDQDVRWCGNIKLSPNDFDTTEPSLNVQGYKTVLLDRGLSPERHVAYEQDANGKWLFNEPTVFICLPNSYFHLDPYSDVIVDNGSTLIVEADAKLEVHSGARVIIRNGGKLIIREDGALYLHDGGQVVVEETGTLVYEDGAKISLMGTSASIHLNKGILQLGDASGNPVDFGFESGSSGYIKVTPSSESQYNITANPGSEMHITGANTTGLFVDQYTLHIPEEIIDFTVTGANVLFEAGARLSIEKASVDFDDCLITSRTGSYNGHRGIHVYGQLNVKFNHCTFQYGELGIYAPLFVNGGHSLWVINSTFRNNHVGIRAQGGAVMAINNNFHDNVLDGIVGYGLDRVSNISGSTFDDNRFGISVVNSNASYIKAFDNDFTNNYRGAYVEGGTYLSRCSNYASNTSAGILGAYLADLELGRNIPTHPDGGRNYFSGTGIAIQLDAASLLDIHQGENIFDNEDFAVVGRFSPTYTGTTSLLAEYNRWPFDNPPMNFSDYYITFFNGTTVTLDATPVLPAIPAASCVFNETSGTSHSDGGGGLVTPAKAIDPDEDCTTCTDIITPSFYRVGIHLAVQSAIDSMRLKDSIGNDLLALDLFHEILTYNYNPAKNDDLYHLDLAWHFMQKTFGNALSEDTLIVGTATFDDYADKMISSANALLYYYPSNDTNTYDHYMKIQLDKAQIMRTAEMHGEALDVLDSIYSIADTFYDDIIDIWTCMITKEKMIFDGIYPAYKFDSLIAACDSSGLQLSLIKDEGNNGIKGNIPGTPSQHANGKVQSQSGDMEGSNSTQTLGLQTNSKTGNQFRIYPNPAKNQIYVELPGSLADGVVRILDLNGKVILKQKLSSSLRQEISTGAIAAGVYRIEIYNNTSLLYSQRVVFMK